MVVQTESINEMDDRFAPNVSPALIITYIPLPKRTTARRFLSEHREVLLACQSLPVRGYAETTVYLPKVPEKLTLRQESKQVERLGARESSFFALTLRIDYIESIT